MSARPGGDRLRVLHLIHVLGETNSQYNEHCLPAQDLRELTICPYFTPRLTPPDTIAVCPGDDTIAGFFRALHRAVRTRRPDVVHAHSPQTGVMLALYLLTRPGLAGRTVYTVHDSFPDYRPRNKLLMLAPLATARRVVFCGESAYESLPVPLRRVVGRRARVVQNAADLDRVAGVVSRAAPAPRRPFTVAAVARLEPVKQPKILLRSFAAGLDAPARLVLMGDGTLRDSVVAEANALGLAGRACVTGIIPREEVFGRFADADVFLSTSRGEGLPVSAMEAMAAGLPLILSDIPPHRELVGDAPFATLVGTGDVAGYAAALRRLHAMPAAQRDHLSSLAQAYVREQFPMSRMVSGYEAVYRQLARPR